MQPIEQNTNQTPSTPLPKTSSSKKIILVITAVVFVFIIASALSLKVFMDKSKKIKTQNSQNITRIAPTSTQQNTDPQKLTHWKAPTGYIALDSQGNLIMGEINSEKTYIIFKKPLSKYATVGYQNVSPDGKYITFLTFPQSILDDFEKNPPIEIHGSDSYELHLADISNPETITESVIAQKVYSGMGEPSPVRWINNSTLVYQVYNNTTNETEQYRYNLGKKTSEKEGVKHAAQNSTSPSGNYYSVIKQSTKDQPNTKSISTYNNLLIGNSNSGKEEIVYQDFLNWDQTSTVFLDDDRIILTREDFARQEYSDCYVELITISTKTVKQIEKRECPPGSSYTNIYAPIISPDGTYLAALYAEDPFSPDGTFTPLYKGAVFLYNFTTGEKKYIFEKPYWYGKMLWLSKTELLILTSGAHVADPKKEAYIYDIINNTSTPHPILNGKDIVDIY